MKYEVLVKPNVKNNNSYINTREIVKELLTHKIEPEEKIEIENLTIQGHLYLKNYPNFLISLSHSKKHSCAVLVDYLNCLSIGVDLEDKNRVFPDGAKKYIINEYDQVGPFSLLELWVIKEACYKAIAPFIGPMKLKRESILKDIVITLRQEFYFVLLPEVKGHFQIQKKEIILGLAWIPRESKDPSGDKDRL